MISKKKNLIYIFSLAALAYFFQNCGGAFESAQTNNGSIGSVTPTPTPAPIPTPTPVPTPVPVPAPTPKALLETHIYLGGARQILPLKIMHQTGGVFKLDPLNINTRLVGWMNLDLISNFMIIIDAFSPPTATRARYAPATGALTLENSVNNIGLGVHATLIKGLNNYFLYAADYDRGQLGLYSLSNSLENLSALGAPINYGNSARTHSSAYDSKRNLLFVANLGNNQINIYRVNISTGALTAAGAHAVAVPRMLNYDAVYDKLYLATEATVGPSYLYGYSIVDDGQQVTLAQIAELSMPKVGADVKVDHAHRFVIGTAREIGLESVWGMPITATGTIDPTRTAFNFKVNRVQPRSLEVSADGQFAIVAMNSAQTGNIQVYKLTFDQNLNFVSAPLIFEDLFGSGFASSTSMSVFEP